MKKPQLTRQHFPMYVQPIIDRITALELNDSTPADYRETLLRQMGVRIYEIHLLRSLFVAKAHYHQYITTIQEALTAHYGELSFYEDASGFLVFSSDRLVGRVVMTYHHFNLDIIVRFDLDCVKDVANVIESVLPESTHIPVDRWMVDTVGGTPCLEQQTFYMEHRPHNEYSNALFPMCEEGVDVFYTTFMASTSNVTLLMGVPGTGKSSFIQQCVQKAHAESRPVYVCDRDDVILHPSFITQVQTECEGGLLIVEDADALIEKRSEGNLLVSALLNLTSGVIKSNIKIMITTNVPNLKSIDDALLRPGRTFKIMNFKPLVGDQINHARAALQQPPLSVSPETTLTLAEALNQDIATTTPTSLGFL